MSRTPIWPPVRKILADKNLEYIRFKKKFYYLGRPGSPEADAKYSQLLLQLQPSLPIGIPAPVFTPCYTVAQIIAEWCRQEMPRYSASSREPAQYKATLIPLLELFADLPADQFDACHLEKVRMAMARNCNRSVINRRVVRIRTLWRWAESQRMVPAGSWHHLQTLRGLSGQDARIRQPKKRPLLTEQDIFKICSHALPTVKDMMLLQYYAGMRSGEVRTMVNDGWDRSSDRLWTYTPAHHKMSHRGQTRTILFTPQTHPILISYLTARKPKEFLFRPAVCRRPGQCYSETSYAQAARRSAIKAGFPSFHPYLLRHEAKQRFLREYGLDVARVFLGQKSLDTTNLYGDALDLQIVLSAIGKHKN